MKTGETKIKYAGYLNHQRKSIDRLKKAEQRVIPDWFDYAQVSGLSREMNEKLQRVRPRTLGHASRIPGVTPAAVSHRRSEEHMSELQSPDHLVCRLLLEKKKKTHSHQHAEHRRAERQ